MMQFTDTAVKVVLTLPAKKLSDILREIFSVKLTMRKLEPWGYSEVKVA